MTSPYIVSQTEETRAIGQNIASRVHGGMLLVLAGDLGAGKTTLAQGILAALGAEAPYPSPTFILMHQYDISGHAAQGIRRIYHVDAYRVDAEALINVGWDEWRADPEGLILLEWPERVPTLITGEHIRRVHLAHTETGERSITSDLLEGEKSQR